MDDLGLHERRRGPEYALHKAVYENDVKLVSKLLKTSDVGQKDIHGLHIFKIVQTLRKFAFLLFKEILRFTWHAC